MGTHTCILLLVLNTHDTHLCIHVHVHVYTSNKTTCVQCKSPICIPLFQAIHDTLPFKAKVMMERLIAVSQDAVFKLETEPVSTLDFVNLLKLVYNVNQVFRPNPSLYLALVNTHL